MKVLLRALVGLLVMLQLFTVAGVSAAPANTMSSSSEQETPVETTGGNEAENPNNALTDSQEITESTPVDDGLKVEPEIQDKEKEDSPIVRELIENRTMNSKHYLKADGTIEAVITSSPQHYMGVNGHLNDIDLRLVDEADIDEISVNNSNEFSETNKQDGVTRLEKDRSNSSFRAPKVPYDVKIPKRYSKGYSVGTGKEKLTFIPQDAADDVVGAVANNVIRYSGVWKDTDVELETGYNVLKETIIVNSSNAPRTFTFEVKGNLAENLTSGSLFIAPAWLVDNAGVMKDVAQTVRKESGKTYIDLHYNTVDLQFPIKIDPTVTIQIDDSNGQDAYVTDSTINQNYNTNTLSVYAVETPTRTYHWDTLIQFPIDSVLMGKVINKARVQLYRIAIGAFAACRIPSPWSESSVTWATSSLVTDCPQGSSGASELWDYAEVTNIVQSWVNGTYPNYGFRLKSNLTTFQSQYASSEDPDPARRPQLVIEYSQAEPTTPLLLSPNGGETVDSQYTVAWNASSDAQTVQSELQYQIQLSTNNGISWTDIMPLTAKGVVSNIYNFGSIAATNTALIRVRAYDGSHYSAWDQSDAVFKIRRNQAPSKPGGASPGSVISTTPTLVPANSTVLNWTFADPDTGDMQTGYQIELYKGTSLITDTGWIASSLSSHTFSGLLENNVYNWRVRTKDAAGAVSAFSDLLYVKTNSLPTLSITSYSDGQSVPDNILSFNWTYSDANGQAQTAYKVQGSRDNWATISYDSGAVYGVTLTHLTTPLANGKWDFRLSVNDGVEWSKWQYRSGLQLPNSFEPNDSSSNAFPVQYTTPYSTIIGTSTDIDWYSYTPTQTGVDEVFLNVPTGVNYDVFVYDKDLQLIASGVRSSAVSEDIIFKVNAGTKYYIKVIGVGGNFSTTSAYTLVVGRMNLTFQTIYEYDENGNIKSKTTTVNN